jgi:hypothetical protein
MIGGPGRPIARMQHDLQSLLDVLIQINQLLTRLEQKIDDLHAMAGAPSIGLRVIKLSNTAPGDNGQVTPGAMILDGTKASQFFQGLGHATVLPLNDLPPWTHMALAKGDWWLIQMA